MKLKKMKKRLWCGFLIGFSVTVAVKAEPVTYSKLEDVPTQIMKSFKDVEDGDGEINGFEFSAVVAMGERLIIADNETRKIVKGLNSSKDQAQALFEVKVNKRKLALKRAWEKSFADYRKRDYDDIESLAFRKNDDGTSTLFMLGSHSLNKKGKTKEERHVLIQVKVDSDGEVIDKPLFERSLMNPIKEVLRDLLVKHNVASHALEAQLMRLNMEGLAFDKSTGNLLIGLRAPLAGDKAIILELVNPDKLFTENEKPILQVHSLLNLHGHGIAALDESAGNGEFYVAASPKKENFAEEYSSLWKGTLGENAELKELMRFPGHKLEGVTQIVSEGELNGKLVLVFDEENENEQFGRILILK